MIVVTGVGAVSPSGVGTAPAHASLARNPSSAQAPPAATGATQDKRISEFDPASILGPKGLRLLDRATLLALVAGHLALRDAGLLEQAPDWAGGRAPGLVLGTSFGSLASITGYVKTRLAHGAAALNPSLFPNTVVNSPASQAAIRFGLRALCTTIATGWASGAEAIGYACDALRRGRADIILAGGAEELAPDNLAIYQDLGIAPATGFGEGACLLVLEREDDAARRGARVLARIAGRGSGFDPDGTGRGMERAIAETFSGKDWPIDLIISGANGIPALDLAEDAALATYHGPRIRLKDRIGECDGAGGALAAAFGVRACSGGLAPGYNSEVGSALVCAPSYTGHAAALWLKRGDG